MISSPALKGLIKEALSNQQRIPCTTLKCKNASSIGGVSLCERCKVLQALEALDRQVC